MRSRCLALLAILALSGGLAACGSDDEPSTDIPRTSPDLTIPSQTTVLPADTTADTTTVDTTTDTTEQVTPPAAVAPPAAVPPPVAQAPASTTGGAAAGPTGGGTNTSGGAQAGQDFQDFCRDNPGARQGC